MPAVPALLYSPEAPDSPQRRAGEIVLTPGQKAALLRIRGSDWSKAILDVLRAGGHGSFNGGDFHALIALGFAINKGRFHVLTPQGRWRADRVAVEIARGLDMHVVTYDEGGRYGRAASAKCTCGWSTFRTRAIASWPALISRDAHHHLQHVGDEP